MFLSHCCTWRDHSNWHHNVPEGEINLCESHSWTAAQHYILAAVWHNKPRIRFSCSKNKFLTMLPISTEAKYKIWFLYEMIVIEASSEEGCHFLSQGSVLPHYLSTTWHGNIFNRIWLRAKSLKKSTGILRMRCWVMHGIQNLLESKSLRPSLAHNKTKQDKTKIPLKCSYTGILIIIAVTFPEPPRRSKMHLYIYFTIQLHWDYFYSAHTK